MKGFLTKKTCIINAVGLHLPGNQSVTLKINLIHYSLSPILLFPLGLNNLKLDFSASQLLLKIINSFFKVSQVYSMYFLSLQGQKHHKHIKAFNKVLNIPEQM